MTEVIVCCLSCRVRVLGINKSIIDDLYRELGECPGRQRSCKFFFASMILYPYICYQSCSSRETWALYKSYQDRLLDWNLFLNLLLRFFIVLGRYLCCCVFNHVRTAKDAGRLELRLCANYPLLLELDLCSKGKFGRQSYWEPFCSFK